MISFIFCAVAYGQDLGTKHQAFCESPLVRLLKGKSGDCRIVITPKKSPSKQGMCKGTLLNSLACRIDYIVDETIAAVRVQCGDENKLYLNQIEQALITDYSVSAVVTKDDGQETMVMDRNVYSAIQSNIALVTLAQESSASVQFMEHMFRLTDVTCQ